MATSNVKLAFGAGNVWSESALSNTPITVKATSPTVKGLELINPGNAPVYVKGWHAVSGSVTIGTTAPDFSWMVPALSTRRVLIAGAGTIHPTALSVAATSDKGTAGQAAPAVAPQVKVLYT